MKNIKKLLPLFALILGIGLVFMQSAFKSVAHNTLTTKQWFVYTGTSIAGEVAQKNYDLYESEGEPGSCGSGDMRCAIYAEPDLVNNVIRPDLTNIDEGRTKFQLEP